MAKTEKSKEATIQIVKPTSITVTQKHTSEPVYSGVPGKVEVVALDANGNESGAPFLISEKQYQKSLSDPSKFKLKKNNKQ